ncbi:deazapurine DNA modification protein DpdA family protein [Streptomyces sparsus]
MRFFLGTHQTGWLSSAGIPLFLSHRRLAARRTLPRAAAPWALDSGGFTELSLHGTWRTTPAAYVAAVRRFRDEIGRLEWAAPMDWMCEPWITAQTGLTVADHQRRTVDNFRELRASAPDLPIIPVLQGWSLADYLRCLELYEHAGYDLSREPIVGLGSVCRRQGTSEAAAIVTTLATHRLNLHGFGFKTLGLRACGSSLRSADSLAWSYDARRKPALPGHSHKNCANCQPYALAWRARVLSDLPPWHQPTLDTA